MCFTVYITQSDTVVLIGNQASILQINEISNVQCSFVFLLFQQRHEGRHNYRDIPNQRWDIWSEWSSCTVDCGTGITTRSRDCRSTLTGYVTVTLLTEYQTNTLHCFISQYDTCYICKKVYFIFYWNKKTLQVII